MFGDLVVNLVARVNQFTKPMQQARAVSGVAAKAIADDQKRVARAVEVSQRAQMQAMKDAQTFAEQKAAHQANLAKRVNAMNSAGGFRGTHAGVMANRQADADALANQQRIASSLRVIGIRRQQQFANDLRAGNALPHGPAQDPMQSGGLMAGVVGNAGLALGPIKLVTAALVGMAIAGVGWGTQQILEAEKAQAGFSVMLGSSERAALMLSELKKFGRETGYGAGIQRAAETMLAFGVSNDRVMPGIRAIADIARGDQQRLESLSLAFSQSAAAGRLMGQDLLQMVNAGFNPLQEISRKTGESISDLKKRMEEGKIPFAEVEAAFLSATSEGGKFHGMMDAIKETVGGQLNILVANFGELVKEVTAGLLEGFDLQGALESLNYWLTVARDGLTDWLPTLHAIGAVARFTFDVIVAGAAMVFAFFNNIRSAIESVVGVFVKLERTKPPSITSYSAEMRDAAKAAQEISRATMPKPPEPVTETLKKDQNVDLVMNNGQAMTRNEATERFNRDNPVGDLATSQKRLKLTMGTPPPDFFFEANSRDEEKINVADSVNQAIERKKGIVEADKINEKHAADIRAAEKANRDKLVAEAKPEKLSGAMGVRSQEAYKAIVSAAMGSRGGNPQDRQIAAIDKSTKVSQDLLTEQRRHNQWVAQNPDQVLESIPA